MRAAAVLALGVAVSAHAGRPLTTEDADILAGKACQLEAWIDRSGSETQSWVAPACNFGGRVEWQFAAARSREASVQAKSAWQLDPGFSVGGVIGVARSRESRWNNPYVMLPATASLDDGALSLHAAAGWSRDSASKRDVATWGAAFERSIARFTLLGEVFGENRGSPFVRLGGRYAALPGRLDLDLSVVARANGDRRERIVSIGLVYQAEGVLP